MSLELTNRYDVVLIGGTHDGQRMNIPEDVNEVRLPVLPDVPFSPGFLPVERYLRFVVLDVRNCFVSAELTEEDVFRTLLANYPHHGQVRLQVVNVN